MPRPRPTAIPNKAEFVAKARATLAEKGVVRISALGPVALRSVVVDELVRVGFEATKTVVRCPLETQLLDRLKTRKPVPIQGARFALAGATLGEGRRTALELVRSGRAHLVVVAKVEALVCVDEDVLTRDEMRTARDAIVTLAKRLQTLTKAGSWATLIRADLVSAISALPLAVPSVPATVDRHLPEVPAVSRATAEWSARLEELLWRAIDAVCEDAMGMSFVPRIVRALAPDLEVHRVHALLLEASRRNLIELRPESGLGRLTDDELRACLPGPQGTKLSWARRL